MGTKIAKKKHSTKLSMVKVRKNFDSFKNSTGEKIKNQPMKVDKDFSAARYASGVANELLWALEGLVEER